MDEQLKEHIYRDVTADPSPRSADVCRTYIEALERLGDYKDAPQLAEELRVRERMIRASEAAEAVERKRKKRNKTIAVLAVVFMLLGAIVAFVLVFAWQRAQTPRLFFDMGDGEVILVGRYEPGTVVTLEEPYDERRAFVGWFADAAFTQPIDSVTISSGDLTVYAKWKIRGSGTVDDPYLVFTPAQFAATVAQDAGGGVFYQSADWSVGEGYTPPQNFSGIFDGNGYTVSLQAGKSLFASVAVSGVVRRVSVTSVNAFDLAQQYGAIAARNDGRISECAMSGTASFGFAPEADYCGGLVGRNDGTIERCRVMGSMTVGNVTKLYFGGLVGDNAAVVIDCYASYTLRCGTGKLFAGGLFGKTGGTVSNCYAAVDYLPTTYYMGGLAWLQAGVNDNCHFLVTKFVRYPSETGLREGTGYEDARDMYGLAGTLGESFVTVAGGLPKLRWEA